MEKTEKRKKCVFAGTFDPPTTGHKAVVEDALKMFDEVVVAAMVNPAKTPCFTVEQRLEMLALTFAGEPRVRITQFSGTVAELLKREGTDVYVRGIRNTVDFEYENANWFASRKLDEGLTAVYLPCRQELLHVSSGIVRNSLLFGTPIDGYVTDEVKAYIQSVYKKN
ncbi:MAG: pantetheine-phosphate adenylyltransferase [Clostridia bacterium]|nr:pantetheine-phosphate adenylyltransferase [Clostridia bacterium]